MSNYYNLNRDTIEEINAEANVFLLELVDKIDNNNIAMVISYLTKSIKGHLINYLLKHVGEYKNKSLYSQVDKTKSSRNTRVLLDKIAIKEESTDYFSDELINILDSLNES